MKKETKEFLTETILKLALKEEKPLDSHEVYHGFLMLYPEIMEKEKITKKDIKEIVDKINKLEKQEKEKKTENKQTIFNFQNRKITSEDYINKFKFNKGLINFASKVDLNRKERTKRKLPVGRWTIGVNSLDEIAGQNLKQKYAELYGGVQIKDVLDEVMPHRKTILQNRTSCDVFIYAKGDIIASIRIYSILPEHSVEIFGYWRGAYIDKSAFDRQILDFKNRISRFGTKEIIVTQIPLKSDVCDDLKINFTFA